jgi:uncharacterized protein YyaL (SSP411 family)
MRHRHFRNSCEVTGRNALFQLLGTALFLASLALAIDAHSQSRATANDSKQTNIGSNSGPRVGAPSYRYTNRLVHAKSPYLLLHAHNPVDWYPWGIDAFEKARRQNKPIFLSIGYFTCHWCHVMERESYSDSGVADILNQHFISIKVDREERPDIDRLYIAYVEATTGSAGWPLNLLLTPEGNPFFGGTYFQPDQLKSVLQQAAESWNEDHESMTEAARRSAQQLIQIVSPQLFVPDDLQPAILDQVYKKIASNYDSANGGFGGAPKFPMPVTLRFLLRYYARTGQRESLDMTLNTLRAIERGGIHDQLGGGFHRYATDASWLVPHFEKMLYDQAQLAVVYCEAYQITHDRFYADTGRNILDFTLREMQQRRGGFASAEDADSRVGRGNPQAGQGSFYVWTAQEIDTILSKEDAQLFDYAYGVKSGGNVPAQQDLRRELKGKNVLYEAHSSEETAKEFNLNIEQTAEKLTTGRRSLLEARSRRPRPPLDDTIVTAWNGMMISALARASQALSEPRYLESAQLTASFLETHLYDPRVGKLWRSYRAGGPSVDGLLDDYTDLISGLLDLYEAGFDVHWLAWADSLQEKQDRLFGDEKDGGYFDSDSSDPSLLSRTRESHDGAEPAPNSTAAMNLLRLAQFTGRVERRDRAQITIRAFASRLRSDPEAVPALASALDFWLAQTRQILIAGDSTSLDTRELLYEVNSRFLPNKILLLGDGGVGQQQLARWLPFVAGAHRMKNRATAYVCENYICDLPTVDPDVLARLLDNKQ